MYTDTHPVNSLSTPLWRISSLVALVAAALVPAASASMLTQPPVDYFNAGNGPIQSELTFNNGMPQFGGPQTSMSPMAVVYTAGRCYDPMLYGGSKVVYPDPSLQHIDTLATYFQFFDLLAYVLVHRHGTRFPTTPDGRALDKLAAFAKTVKPTNPSLNWIKTWTNPFLKYQWENLHDVVGCNNLRHKANRDRRLFHDALVGYKGQVVGDVEATPKPRVEDSMFCYLKDFYGPSSTEAPTPVVLPANQQKLWAPWGNCAAYKTQIKGNTQAAAEKKKLNDQTYVPIANRLTPELGVNVNPGQVKAMLTACLFMRTLFDEHGQWCTLFTEGELQADEYFNDVVYYYAHGPGNQINGDMMGEAMDFIMTKFEAAARNINGPPAFILRFNHAETVMHLGTLLGIFKEAPTHVGDYYRAFRQTRDIPFAANLMLLLIRPKPEYQSVLGTEPMVMILLNERVIDVPYCDRELCPLSQFLSIHQKWRGSKSDVVCQNPPSTGTAAPVNGANNFASSVSGSTGVNPQGTSPNNMVIG